jgi:DNA polymerase
MKLPEYLRKRGIKRILGLDWETYFDVDYTLKKMSTSEYVRDSRFKAHGVGIQTSTSKTGRWVTKNIKQVLNKIDWSTTAILCHHGQFDGLVLSHHYKIKPAYMLDTLSMARVWIDHSVGNSLDEVASYYGIGNKLPDVLQQTKGIRTLPPILLKDLGAYCKQDVFLTLEILQIMWEEGFPIPELDLIDLTVRMFTDPVLKVDKPRAKEELERVIAHNKRMIKNTAGYFGIPRSVHGDERMEMARATLSSDLKLQKALEAMGIAVPMKTTPKGNVKPAFAKNDLAFHELQMHPDRRVRKICEARLVVKSTVEESKATKLLAHADPALPIYLNYGKAHTYRWTGGDKMNPQNFPRGGVLRRCIKAPRGQQLVVVDSGQIEARVVAWLAEQWDLLEVFADPKRDPYCELAEEIFHHHVTKKDKRERFVGKVGVLGLGFGMGWAKYRYTLASGSMGAKVNIDELQAQTAVNTYRQRNDKIVKFWKTMENMLHSMEKDQVRTIKDDLIEFSAEAVKLPNGLSLSYPELRQKRTYDNMGDGFQYWNGHKRTKIYGGLFTENLTQAVARIIVANQMLEIAEKYRVVMMTHDEAVYLAPTRQAQAALDFGLEVFQTSKDWYSDIPLFAEGGYAPEYSK